MSKRILLGVLVGIGLATAGCGGTDGSPLTDPAPTEKSVVIEPSKEAPSQVDAGGTDVANVSHSVAVSGPPPVVQDAGVALDASPDVVIVPSLEVADANVQQPDVVPVMVIVEVDAAAPQQPEAAAPPPVVTGPDLSQCFVWQGVMCPNGNDQWCSAGETDNACPCSCFFNSDGSPSTIAIAHCGPTGCICASDNDPNGSASCIVTK